MNPYGTVLGGYHAITKLDPTFFDWFRLFSTSSDSFFRKRAAALTRQKSREKQSESVGPTVKYVCVDPRHFSVRWFKRPMGAP